MARKPTRELIFEAAVRLAAERGISGTTMDDIALAAGVAKGSLYYNFSSKDEIFGSVIERAFEGLTEGLRQSRTTGSPDGDLRAMFRTLLERIRDNSSVARIIVTESFRTDRAWVSSLGMLRKAVIAQFQEVIEQMDVRLRDRPDQSRLLAASVFGGALMAGLDWLTFEPEVTIERVVDTLVAPVEKLAAAAPPRQPSR